MGYSLQQRCGAAAERRSYERSHACSPRSSVPRFGALPGVPVRRYTPFCIERSAPPVRGNSRSAAYLPHSKSTRAFHRRPHQQYARWESHALPSARCACCTIRAPLDASCSHPRRKPVGRVQQSRCRGAATAGNAWNTIREFAMAGRILPLSTRYAAHARLGGRHTSASAYSAASTNHARCAGGSSHLPHRYG